MLLDLIDLRKLRRATVYGLLMAGIFLVQNMVLANVPVYGVRPLLIPSMVMGVALYEGGLWGGIVGLAAGYFSDMASAGHLVLFTILLPLAGYLAGGLGKYMLRKGFVSYMALTALMLGVIAFCQMFRFIFFIDEDARLFQALYWQGGYTWRVVRTGLLQTGWSLVWAVPIYFPCRRIAGTPIER